MNARLQAGENGADPNGSGSDIEYDKPIDLAQIGRTLWLGKWKILVFIGAAILVGVFKVSQIHPSYQANALLQIQSQNQSPLQGVTSDLEEITGGSSSPAQGQMQIISSRSVLGDTVKKLNLQTTVHPSYFPYIGYAIAKRRHAGTPAAHAVAPDSGSWLARYAWRPVTAEVSRMDVPKSLYGKSFKLRALGNKQFVLLDTQGRRILSGTAGHADSGRTPQGKKVSLFVAKIATNSPPTDFILVKHRWLPVVNGLHSRLQVQEQGKNTGIVSLSLTGSNRQAVTRILNSIAKDYVQQNVDERSKHAQRSLKFLNGQLPKLRAKVNKANDRLAHFRTQHQVADLSSKGRALLTRAENVEEKKSQLKVSISQLRQTYTSEYPSIQGAKRQLHELNQQNEQLQQQINQLPEAEKKLLAIQRDVQVSTQLYTSLLNRAQELRIAKAGAVGNVRIVDKAVAPAGPLGTHKSLILLLMLMVGGFLGCVFVLAQSALRRGVTDPKAIENGLGLPVYAVVPYSRWLTKASSRAHRRRYETAAILARDHSDDVAVEALLSLRTTLYFEYLSTGTDTITISGPKPGVGKSFLSINLAYLLADIDKKIVVVDADMRRGRLQEFVAGTRREPGLSELLRGKANLSEAIRDLDGGSNIKILPTGALSSKPSSLLMRQAFARTIEQLRETFDLVIVDAPPILAVTDAAVIAASIPGSANLLIARSGEHPLAELRESVKRLSGKNYSVSGIVINAYRRADAQYTGDYQYYHYQYKTLS